jgi:hypothetical protein
LQNFVQLLFINGTIAGVNFLDLRGIAVDTHYFVPYIRQTDTGHESDIACSHH